ncbi:outer membrane beta-barrel protein [Epilithonimonas sp. UC225_85]|uniref:outer membrane beta-barrel protein n=1 Tax=Epilithonimonas sp. UC225_85 TaxID=3350167 RepID=UPI0036D26EE6
MKPLYKTIFATLCIFFSLTAKAQRLDILGGVNLTGIKYKTAQPKIDESGNVGLHVGLAVFVPFSASKFKKDDEAEGYGLIPTLQYVKKGSSNNSVINNSAADIKLGFLQLNLPLAYTANNIDIGVGPYVAYAVSGNKKYRVGNGAKEKIDFDNELGRMDYGVGIQFTAYMFKFQYDLGLANLAKGNGDKANTRSISISLNIPLVQ